ncbi:hypothetical protein [Streptomyces sp. NRRL S-646]|uniref:hypothetical protein n=1 Tax=Streptomyces sp. NRRL S-646 TaxID=1463917 RepID=UPI000A9D47D9|nr:hypothetical protein [Streptomyces sp. NRRL S-646]
MAREPVQDVSVPYFDIRIGTFRVTADRIPARLLTLLSSVGTGAAAWFWSR